MPPVSAILQRLEESATLAMARKSRELTAAGFDVISLSLGEPDFNTPNYIKQAAIEAIEQNVSKYPPVNGFLDVREAISAKFKRDNGLFYTANQIVISTGAKQSIINVILSLVNPGDEVILLAPYWVSYREMVNIAGGNCVVVNADIERNFKVNAAEIQAAVTPKTKLIIFSSPCNPTGSVYSRSELESIAQVVLAQPDLYIISDEIYEHINFAGDHFSIASVPGMAERTVTVNGVSKAFAMTGWRIGYIGAPQWIADACTKIQGQFTSGANTIAQKATKAAVLADPTETHHMRDAFKRRRDLVVSKLKEIKGLGVNHPDGAFYLFPDVSHFLGKSVNGKTIHTAAELCTYILETVYVAVVDGEAFGAPSCIRLSYATSDELLIEAISRIKKALEQLS
ncbi:MAG TPA: pyridoxal phosphate-dependent aminotransferase [Luteibaculaceae bacterium]|nr:pyridoxal phosphate-dependent aminotransferase [Luteibaculaceae bacterium]